MTDDPRTKHRRATQRDVAEAAGVDRATVSRALDPAKRSLISPETVERVLSATERLGYRTNALARGLRTSRSDVIGLEIPSDVHNAASLFGKPLSVLITSVEERLRSSGQTLLIAFAAADDRAASPEHFGRSGIVDGVIRLHAGHPARASSRDDVPSVSIGLESDPSYDIVVDERRGIEIAVEHLHRLGHRRIALVSEPPRQPRGARHLSAYRDAMFRLGLAQTDGSDLAPLVAHYHEQHPASAPEAVEAILSREPRPTAIVFTDDKAAMGGYGVLRTHRLRIPEDVSVVGWRDNDADMFLVPPLTTVALPMRAAAFAAASLILKRVDGDRGPAAARVFAPHLIQRDSTLPPQP